MARIDQTPFEVDITDLTHDGRGVARRPDPKAPGAGGKAVFVAGALPGERVVAVQTGRHRSFDEARAVDVLRAAPERVSPRCPHFGTCSGCALQHYDESRQIVAKQRVLLENLERIGHVTPGRVLPPLTDAAWGYRRKGRFSVRRVEKKDKTLVGFREVDPRFVADIGECHTVIPEIGSRIPALAALVDAMDGRRDIPQIEFIAGDSTAEFDGVALTFRHLQPLSDADKAKLAAFAEAEGFSIFLQPGGIDTVKPLWPEQLELSFALPDFDLHLAFRPLDFIQVNAGLNDKMIRRALELLDPQPQDRVLDLFCGLGNFTLPLATRAREAVGVEGSKTLTDRAMQAARDHGLQDTTSFATLNLFEVDVAWLRGLGYFDRMLIDPPREGAHAVAQALSLLSPAERPKRIVYVSCNPSTLARDASIMVHEGGYAMLSAGVINMFPHTGHVESIAVFESRDEATVLAAQADAEQKRVAAAALEAAIAAEKAAAKAEAAAAAG